MKIIADSGSTKTDWVVLVDNIIIKRFSSIGINPIYKSINDIKNIIKTTFSDKFNYKDVKEIYFYCAGCMSYENSDNIKQSLRGLFLNSIININSDILGAAQSLFRKDDGIAIILGTGANICIYNNQKIISTRSGIGYILGDEGSGAHIGKSLIQDYLNDNMPKEIKKIFELNKDFEKSLLINTIYRKPNANVFLSKFSVIVKEHIDIPYFYLLVKNSFISLFEIHIKKISNINTNEIGFVGSVAFYFQDILREVANEYNIKVKKIIQKPIDGLIEYHLIS